MDISFQINNGKFNFRVCAMIIENGRILAMKDGRSPYYYLPGGRVKFRESVEDAALREVREELGIEAKIVRPLWVNQAFFTEDVEKKDYHELCFYFLMDASETDFFNRGEKFILKEGEHEHRFEWLDFSRLKDEYFYPIFLKKDIFNLPDVLTLRTEIE